MIPGTCPDCGTVRPLSDYLADAEARAALVAALACPADLARIIIPYLSLHAPAGRRIQMGKLARLLRELADLIGTGTVTRHTVTHPAPLALWQAAIEQVLSARDGGALTLPLDGHGYLTAVAHGMAAKGQRAAPAAPAVSHPSHRPADPAYIARRSPSTVAPSRGAPAEVGALLAAVRHPAPPSEDTPA